MKQGWMLIGFMQMRGWKKEEGGAARGRKWTEE